MSIHLTTAQANSFNVTLSEVETATYTYYLIAFTNDQTGTEYTVIDTDASTNVARWSKFTITEGADDRTNGSLVLGNAGSYSYEIYGQTSSSNLLTASALQLLEIGKMWLDNGVDDTFTKNTETGNTFVVNNSEV